MKRILAAAGLLALSACGGDTAGNIASNGVESHEEDAAALSVEADNVTSAAAQSALDNAMAAHNQTDTPDNGI